MESDLNFGELAEAYELSVPTDDKELTDLERQWAAKIMNAWLTSSEEGKRYASTWDSPANLHRLVEGVRTTSYYLNMAELSKAFLILERNQVFETPPPPEPSEKEVWEQNCRKWMSDPKRSTKEISTRYQNDRAFRSFVESNKFDLVLESGAELQAQAHVLGSEASGYHEDAIAWQKESEKAERQKDRRFLELEQAHPGIHQFAAQFKTLSATETRKRLEDVNFKRQVEVAAAAGLI
jgi:hypothetical protein